MGYRSFTDSRGDHWQAWDITPRLDDRRVRDRRSASASVDAERRGRSERRRVNIERGALNGGLKGGWLCFQSAGEKRRLAPVPADWLRCPVTVLESYLERAARAPRLDGGSEVVMERRAG